MNAIALLAACLMAAFVGLTGCDGHGVEIVTDALPNGQVGVRYVFELEVDGDADDFVIVSGQLPPGINLSDEGIFSGTPITAGVFTFTVEARDHDHQGDTKARDTKGFSLTIDE